MSTRKATVRPVDKNEVEAKDSTPGRRVKPRWKLVVAAETPWRGAVYETRAGQHREEFDGPQEFLQAIARLTGWRLADD